MPDVYGNVRVPYAALLKRLILRALDIDVGQSEVLGEVTPDLDSGTYEISYSARRAARAERRSADLVVCAILDGRVVAESEVLFNAGGRERIDLDLSDLSICEDPEPSELDALIGETAPLANDRPPRSWSDRDIVLLSHELGDKQAPRARLLLLRDADRAARPDLPLAAFYGWFRVLDPDPRSAETLARFSAKQLTGALDKAVKGRIVATESIDDPGPEALVRALRNEVAEAPNRVVLRLVNAVDSLPLARFAVTLTDSEGTALGLATTDGQGQCALDLPPTATALTLDVTDPRPGRGEITLPEPSDVPIDVRIELAPAPGEEQPISDSALAERLRAQGIETFEALLARPDLEDADDPEGLSRLRAEARLELLAPDLDDATREALAAAGLDHGADFVARSRPEIVEGLAEVLGGATEAHATHDGMRRTHHAVRHMLNDAWFQIETDPGDDPDPPRLPDIVIDELAVETRCSCEDCETAASPAAYLAHLISWTIEHVRDVSARITLAQLEEEFHQPFADLPADCGAVEERVCQIRLAVEALWRFNGTLGAADLQLPTPFRLAYRRLRNDAYRNMLAVLGTSFEQLRDAQLDVPPGSVSAEIRAQRRAAAATALGIAEERLGDLWVNVDQPPISPDEELLQSLFGLSSTRRTDLFSDLPRPTLVDWQREYLLAAWQQQDWHLDAYAGDNRLPAVDPAVITDAHLRTPLDINPAAALYDARREALELRRASYVAADPATTGLAALLTAELGVAIANLRALHAVLGADPADPEAVASAQDDIAALGLTLGGFTLLLDIDARQIAGDPIADAPEDVDARWEAAFDALLRAHRLSLHSAWVTEEDAAEVVLGPQWFWLPETPQPVSAPWLASESERAAWQAALTARAESPILDPDQIGLDVIVDIPAPGSDAVPLEAIDLWQNRRAFIDARLEALGNARQGTADGTAALAAMLDEAELDLDLAALDALRAAEVAGEQIAPQLGRIGLDLRRYRPLAQARLLTDAGEALGPEDWDVVEAALVAAEKRRLTGIWQREEQAAGLVLHPDWFAIPDPAPAPPDTPHATMLRDGAALRAWQSRLRARSLQLTTLDEALALAVAEVETGFLIGLRDLLINASVAPGPGLPARARWLDRRLLIDMQLTCCESTTRVGQATLTLQRFLRGIYTSEHLPIMQHLAFDADEDYVAEWPVIGTYTSWRAYVLAYLYPENLLHLTPPPRMSRGYRNARRALGQGLTPKSACKIATDYGAYFRDVTTLTVQASCQVQTVTGGGTDPCAPTGTAMTSRLHLFGHAPESGLVYWAHLDPAGSAGDTITTWIPLGRLGPVDRIIAATPHEVPGGGQVLLLFVQEGAGLKIRQYNPVSDTWGRIRSVNGPPGASDGIAEICVVQKRQSGGAFDGLDYTFPTLVCVSLRRGPAYLRAIRPDLAGWTEAPWLPIYGPALGAAMDGVRAILQINSSLYALIADIDGEVVYRRVTLTDDGLVASDSYEWRRIARGRFRGAFVSPSRSAFFCFFRSSGETRYRQVSFGTNFLDHDDDAFAFTDIEEWQRNWLVPVLGIDLDDEAQFAFDRYVPEFFIPRDFIILPQHDFIHPPGWVPLHTTDEDGNEIAVSQGDWNGDPYFSGSLLGLLTRDFDAFRPRFIPPFDEFSAQLSAEFNDDLDWDRYFYLVQQKYRGIELFADWLKGGRNKGYFDDVFGWWNFADDRIRELSEDSMGLADTLLQFAVNKIVDEGNALVGGTLNWGPRGQSRQSLRFARRDADPRGPVFTISQDDWSVPPHSGEERVEPQSFIRMTVVVMPRGGASASMAVPTAVSDETISGTAPFALAPFGDGPYDGLPLRGRAELQLRRQQIALMWAPLEGERPSVTGYLREAFLHLPMAIGYQLCQAGYFDEALGWYRLVFDYLAPPAQRRIAYSLRAEGAGPLAYDALDAFLSSPDDVHAIAGTRRNSYTRHVILLIAECLINQADELFTRDTASGNARAKELYRLALRLLRLPVMRPGRSACAEIIAELEIELEDTVVPWVWLGPILRQEEDPDRLRDFVARLRAVAAQSASLGRRETVRELRALVDTRAPRDRRTLGGALDRQSRLLRRLEGPLLAAPGPRALLRQSFDEGRTRRRRLVGTIAGPGDAWLAARPTPDPVPDPAPDTRPAPVSSGAIARRARATAAAPVAGLGSLTSRGPGPGDAISFSFCVPQNPVTKSLRARAEGNLEKLRSCRNIAGLRRELDPYGAPIGIGAVAGLDGAGRPQVLTAPPTPYRFGVLIDRAKELVSAAERMEDGYRTALESAEREALNELQAEQAVELAGAHVVLRDLETTRAVNGVTLAERQRDQAAFRAERYSALIDAGLNSFEDRLIAAVTNGMPNQRIGRRLFAVGEGIVGLVTNVASGPSVKGIFKGVQEFLQKPIQTAMEIDADISRTYRRNEIAMAELRAGYTRRAEQWQIQQGIAARDLASADAQIRLSLDDLAIARQEREIAELQQTHAADVLAFLQNRIFDEEMYLWIAGVLSGVYRELLQSAAATAQMAEAQLAFERQEAALGVVRPDYWRTPQEDGPGEDRRGLTGSARLLRDIYALDQYAFATLQRKERLFVSLDLARLYPSEFQSFRETGRLVFETPLSLFEQQFPGHYLCLIERADVFVAAELPESYGLRGALSTAGTSRVVVGGEGFRSVYLQGLPERIPLFAEAASTNGVTQLLPESGEAELRRPLEGTGFETQWELSLPKAANPIDYNQVASVFVTLELSALWSSDRERQVVEAFEPQLESYRIFSLAEEFSEAWADLTDPAAPPGPRVFGFRTEAADFPPNLSDLEITGIAIAFAAPDGSGADVTGAALQFRPDAAAGPLGGPFTTIGGAASTRRAGGAALLPIIGAPPAGTWELSLPDAAAFAQGGIAGAALILSFSATRPPWRP